MKKDKLFQSKIFSHFKDQLENKIYTKVFNKAKEEDIKKTTYQNNILKYVKNNPNNIFSKRFIKNSLLPYELIDFPVDNNISQQSDNTLNINKIEFETPKKDYEIRKREGKHSDDISNYDCWRSFTADVPYLQNYHDNSRRIRLIPSKLIKVRTYFLLFNNIIFLK